MRLFRPKQGPVLTLGRLLHLLVGQYVVQFGAIVAGYEGLAWACIATLLFGSLWETLTGTIGKKLGWPHLFGDVIDLLAYAVGVIIGASIVLSLGGAA